MTYLIIVNFQVKLKTKRYWFDCLPFYVIHTTRIHALLYCIHIYIIFKFPHLISSLRYVSFYNHIYISHNHIIFQSPHPISQFPYGYPIAMAILQACPTIPIHQGEVKVIDAAVTLPCTMNNLSHYCLRGENCGKSDICGIYVTVYLI